MASETKDYKEKKCDICEQVKYTKYHLSTSGDDTWICDECHDSWELMQCEKCITWGYKEMMTEHEFIGEWAVLCPGCVEKEREARK